MPVKGDLTNTQKPVIADALDLCCGQGRPHAGNGQGHGGGHVRTKVEERHERIMQIVRDRGNIRLAALGAELGVSTETARRDVKALTAIGRVRWVHGSVSWPSGPLSARDARLNRPESVPAAPPGLLIGMIVPVADYFYPEIIRGARAAAAASGARLMVAMTDYDAAQNAAQIKGMINAGADGLLLTPSWGIDGPTPKDCEQIADLDIPTVLVERRVPAGVQAAALDRVTSDHVAGAALAVRHLAGLGHQGIALVSSPTHTAAAIREGYRSAMDVLDLGLDDMPVTLSGPPGGPRSFEETVLDLLRRVAAREVTAALVHTDHVAINLIQRVLARGLRVPEDFALVSYDDELATIPSVQLSAVAPQKRAIGEAAAGLLIRKLTDPTVLTTRIELLPRLVVRESCGATSAAGAGGGGLEP
ncbi:substrate-binding domain-containing protein [Streptacidiphilus sp. MAP5-52]|uniref:substrate-binding domain-containing protein n=1 Tax=Streptacidiphilus sp. MAP5-52 TaxID=3156267 RepID=UPI003512A4ED